MKRLLFAVLMIVCTVSWAKWEYTGKTYGFTEFHDKSTIRRNGAISLMWTLKNYFEVQTGAGKPFKSVKIFWKYNCIEESLAFVSLIHYESLDGNGGVTLSLTRKESELNWEPVVPESISEDEWKIACGKK